MAITQCFIDRNRECGPSCHAYDRQTDTCQFMRMAQSAIGLIGSVVQHLGRNSITVTYAPAEPYEQRDGVAGGYHHD